MYCHVFIIAVSYAKRSKYIHPIHTYMHAIYNTYTYANLYFTIMVQANKKVQIHQLEILTKS